MLLLQFVLIAPCVVGGWKRRRSFTFGTSTELIRTDLLGCRMLAVLKAQSCKNDPKLRKNIMVSENSLRYSVGKGSIPYAYPVTSKWVHSDGAIDNAEGSKAMFGERERGYFPKVGSKYLQQPSTIGLFFCLNIYINNIKQQVLDLLC